MYNVYLDPKNDFLIKTDIDKIKRTAEQNNVKIIILGKKHLIKESIIKVVGTDGNAPTTPECKSGVILFN